jgi:hypothetical protein
MMNMMFGLVSVSSELQLSSAEARKRAGIKVWIIVLIAFNEFLMADLSIVSGIMMK